MEDRLDFLVPRPGGGCALGSSSITQRLWSGSVWLYDDADNVPEISAAKYSYQMNAGVPCGVWISRDILVAAHDGGTLEWLSTSEQPGKFSCVFLCNDNTSTVRSLAVNSNSEKLISVSSSRSLSIYNCGRQEREMLFKPAHNNEIVSVAAHPEESSIFATASLDGNVLLWDIRKEKPASCIYREETIDKNSTPTAVTWIDGGTEGEGSGGVLGNLLIGGIDGRLFLQCPGTRETIAVKDALRRRVTKLIPSKEAPSLVAVCGNGETVKVFDTSGGNLREVYSNAEHTDIVTDCMWLSDQQFLSCSWDKLVIKHSLFN